MAWIDPLKVSKFFSITPEPYKNGTRSKSMYIATWLVMAPERAKSPVNSNGLWYCSGTRKDVPISKIEIKSVINDLDIVKLNFFLSLTYFVLVPIGDNRNELDILCILIIAKQREIMNNYQDLKRDYKFTEEEAKILKELQPRIAEVADEFIDQFYDYIWGFGKTAQFLKNKQIITHHKMKIRAWFLHLFCGEYNLQYFTYLYKVGEIHVKIGLPTHYVNSAFTFVRMFVLKSIEDNYENKEQHLKEIQAVQKIIDMNLDSLTSSYREEELGKFLSLSKIEKNILSGLKKFNSYINYFLAGALAIVAFFAIGLFLYDIYLLFFTDLKIEKGILTVLGSLLVLWASIELIHEEIEHLQGKGFAIGAFIMLAMAALIRKVLIYSLSSEKAEELLIIGAVIVALSISYWLVANKNKISMQKD